MQKNDILSKLEREVHINTAISSITFARFFQGFTSFWQDIGHLLLTFASMTATASDFYA